MVMQLIVHKTTQNMLVLTRYLLLEKKKKKHFYDDVFPSSTKRSIPHFRNECSFFMTARVLFVTIDSILSKGYLLIKCIPLLTLSSGLPRLLYSADFFVAR